ncbi:hypothetical protein FQZ97_1116560 [compost metagenome]
MSNIGRFCWSTIWMCRPSVVFSSWIWLPNSASLGLLLISSAIFFSSASSRAASWRTLASWAIWAPIILAARSASPLSIWPNDLLRSRPPPGRMLLLLPVPGPPMSETFTGDWK